MNSQCINCGKNLRRKRIKFCSVTCHGEYDKRINETEYLKSPKYCKTCNKVFSYMDCRTKKVFCSRSCSATYHNQFHKERSTETREKIRKALLGRKPSPRKKKEKTLISCPWCGNLFPKNWSKYCSKNCRSLAQQQNAINAIGTGRGRKGWYKGIYCQSSYELAYVVYCIDHAINISRCKIDIPYRYEGKHKKYRPDFISYNKIIEIKGYYDKLTEIKLTAASELGIPITIINKIDIKMYINYVCTAYKKTPTTIHELYDQKLEPGATIRTCATF